MANYLITMPDVGEGIAEVEIIEWNVAVGDPVEEDDLLCVVMTDKANVEIPSPVDGKVTWRGPEAGTVMAVGADLLRLDVADVDGGGEGNSTDEPVTDSQDQTEQALSAPTSTVEPETASRPEPTLDPSPASNTEPSAESIAESVATASQTTTDARNHGANMRPEGEKPIAAPAVRQRARNAGIDLRFVHGTGPAKRITHEDLDAYIAAASQSGHIGYSVASALTAASTIAPTSAATEVEEIKVMGLRRKIAAVMQDTMQRIPHYTYVEEVDVTELEKLRSQLNRNRREDQPKLTMLPFFIKALVAALQQYPQMSARFDDAAEVVHQYAAAHVGIATQTDNGLVVPVVRHAETQDIWQLAAAIKSLSEAARDGSISRESLSGSTITITSLGPMGGIATTPVINAPELAVIGINKVAKRPVWQEGGFVPRDMMNLSSSFDHRIIDGWEATQFIHCIKDLLEAPAMLFIPPAS